MLSSKSNIPSIQNYTTVCRNRWKDQSRRLHSSIPFTRQPQSPCFFADPHLEVQTIKVKLDYTQLSISNIYVSPASSCSSGYQLSIDHLMTTPFTLILDDFNAHYALWHSNPMATRGRTIADTTNGSTSGNLNRDTPTRFPSKEDPCSRDDSLASSSIISPISWQTLTSLGSDHLPILIRLQMNPFLIPGRCRTYINLKKGKAHTPRKKKMP